MMFKYVYKCLRCKMVFKGKAVHDSEKVCEFSSVGHEHACGTNENGIGIPVGYDVIDEVVGTPPAGESQPAGKKAASTVSVVIYKDSRYNVYTEGVFRSRSSAEEYVADNFGPEARVRVEDCVIHD